MSNLSTKIGEAELITLEQWCNLVSPKHIATSSLHDDGSYFEYWKCENNSVVKTERWIPGVDRS